MGLSWASPGALLCQLGAILRPRKAIESAEAGRQNNIDFFNCLKGFGILAASLEGSVATWSRLGAVLGPHGASWKPS